MDGQQAAATLGVRRRATTDEIRQAFRAKAKQLHPDTGPAGSMEQFITLRLAFERLLLEARPVAAASATFDTADPAVGRSSGTIDLTDSTRRRPTRAPRNPPTGQKRDANGLSFADHLSAALSRP